MKFTSDWKKLLTIAVKNTEVTEKRKKGTFFRVGANIDAGIRVEELKHQGESAR